MHARGGPADKGDHPAGVDREAHPVEQAVHRLGPPEQRRGQRQQEMKGHAVERAQAGDGVPCGNVARGEAVEEHEVGAEVVAQKAETEDEQVLSVQPLFPCAEHRPGVEDQGEVHEDHSLKKHLIVTPHSGGLRGRDSGASGSSDAGEVRATFTGRKPADYSITVTVISISRRRCRQIVTSSVRFHSRRQIIPSQHGLCVVGLGPHAPVAQLDRVPGFEPGCRRFESVRAYQLKQMVMAYAVALFLLFLPLR